eukprot:927418_1
MMTSTEHTPVSKELLANLHRRQLMNGKTNNAHQEAIVDALGGIDGILQHLFTSDVVLDEQQLDSLHRIITNTTHTNKQTTINTVSRPQEDKAQIMPTLTYTFKDEDSLLFTIFGEENGAKILHILGGKIIICVLSVLFGLFVIAFFLGTFSVVSWDVANAFLVVFYLFCSMYIIMWILYANKEAMKLLFRQFVFWFKIWYLIMYLVVNAIIRHLDDTHPYLNCAVSIFYAALLFIVMIFDAINTQKSTKMIISSLAVGTVAWRMFSVMVNTFYANEWDVYDRAIVTINIPYLDEKARISIVDMCANSAQILAIFLCKQLILIIRNPHKALVIATIPFIQYKNNKETSPTIKNVKHWRRATIVGWTVLLLCGMLFLLEALLKEESHIVYITLLGTCCLNAMIGLCVVMIVKDKFHWILHIIIFIIIIIYVVGIFLFQIPPHTVALLLIIFGLTATYTLKVSEMDKMDGSNQLASRQSSTKSTLHVSVDVDDAMEEISGMLTEEIEMQAGAVRLMQGRARAEESISTSDQKA